jgi:hypothetical protein
VAAVSRLAHPQSLDDLLLYRLSRLLATAGMMVIRRSALYAALFPQVQKINRELLGILAAADVARLETMIERLQRQAGAMTANAELPKADRRRGRDRLRRGVG